MVLPQLLGRDAGSLDLGNYKLGVDGTAQEIKLKWTQIELAVQESEVV